jgi:hypothetical protein
MPAPRRFRSVGFEVKRLAGELPSILIWFFFDFNLDFLYGPQLHGSLGSTGLRPMPPHYSRDLEHGLGAGSGLLPWLAPPTCSRPGSGVETTRRSGLGCARCTHTREDEESPLSWEGMTYGK